MFLARFQALLRAHRCCRSVSSWDLSSNFTAWGLRWWGFLTCIFPNDGPFFSPILAWRSVDRVNCTFRIDPKTFRIGFHRGCFPLWETNASESCDTQPGCDTLFTIATAFLSSLSLLFGKLLLWALYVHQPCDAETDTCLQPYNPFHFHRIDTRADANIQTTFAYKCLPNNICTVFKEWTHGYFCLGYFSSTHFDLVARMAQKLWRHCGLVFVHDLGSRAWDCIGFFANTSLFLSTGNRYLFLPQRRLIPFDSVPLLLFQVSRAWRH